MAASVLVLGIGNVLMSDDGAGVHAARGLEPSDSDHLRVLDGGTLGLSLLAEIETCDALIVFDAARFGAEPGAVKTFTGSEMDAQLSGVKRTAHEVALCDLLNAAELIGRKPEFRALIGVEPDRVGWGLEPTETVASAIPEMRRVARELIERWAS
ncbi:HyaD/HybD family hydrogenase maturation endopeptidase [Rhodoblastus sp.]|jgi:hydrogenase maturation protease|uniref:HyaD/HybD family hydrogenase maturation endopeptidase n=1 Tax=Rhodoblastus sp. TaxID=1962975 RepID=UPI002610B7F6|nr:HyaD/HybD family hydrogenase maturation endopeptidase [Rhodoblastus sp.]